MNAQQLSEIVNGLEINQKIKLGIGNYTDLEFMSDTRDGVTEYSWTLFRETFPYYVFPSASNPNFVKYFKTLAGAKRNLKRYLRHWLEAENA